jgi:DNA mismatch repair protein MSH5
MRINGTTGTLILLADAADASLQLRPHKDFKPIRGRNSLLSLGLLNELPESDSTHPTPPTGPHTEPRNAYEFMRRREEKRGGDPNLRRWNASIRVANFTALEGAPLAVRPAPCVRRDLCKM